MSRLIGSTSSRPRPDRPNPLPGRNRLGHRSHQGRNDPDPYRWPCQFRPGPSSHSRSPRRARHPINLIVTTRGFRSDPPSGRRYHRSRLGTAIFLKTSTPRSLVGIDSETPPPCPNPAKATHNWVVLDRGLLVKQRTPSCPSQSIQTSAPAPVPLMPEFAIRNRRPPIPDSIPSTPENHSAPAIASSSMEITSLITPPTIRCPSMGDCMRFWV